MRALIAKTRAAQQTVPATNKPVRRATTGNMRSSTAPASVDQVLRSPGRPLDRETRAIMEPRFGHDFGRVRVHVDSQAADSARELGARAYTVGHNIAFARGQFAPQTATGQRLLAHELAHTVQQSPEKETAAGLRVAPTNDPLEHEAEKISALIGSGAILSSQITAAAQRRMEPVLQRAPDPDKSPKKEERAQGNGGQGSGSGQTPTPPVPATECKPPSDVALPCTPKGVSDVDFRKVGAPGDALGFTRLGQQGPPPPEVKTQPAGKQVVILKTEAKPFPCDSFFTQASKQSVARIGFFDENDPKQKDNIAKCGKTYIATYVITDEAAKKIEEAELEHCRDFKRAFDISLGCYANVVNDLARKKTRFASEQDAVAEVTKRVGLAPNDWMQHYLDLLVKTRERDDRKWHTAIRPPGPGLQVDVRDKTGSPGPHQCVATQSQTLDESSFPEVGKSKKSKTEKHPSSEIIK
jgi:uncharacterized protein DUF4157